MNRRFTQFRYSLEKKVVDLFAQVTIGASGAPTLVSGSYDGILSFARNSAGNYTLTLENRYVKLLGLKADVLLASGDPAIGYGAVIRSESVASAKTIVIEFLGPTGAGDTTPAATDPASGVKLFLQVTLSATSV